MDDDYLLLAGEESKTRSKRLVPATKCRERRAKEDVINIACLLCATSLGLLLLS